ncbi:streptomycin biosynthesis enzyme StrG [Gynuella sp.]|uniref:streptomycin biosynthesis enzyme StrG n=1 Tax=Gynuella sp. TaxID=2969146 RepID=UPI003D1220CB
MTDEIVDRRQLTDQAGPVPKRPWVLLSYDTSRYPFAYILQRDVFKVPNLGKLHQYVLAHYRKHGVKRNLNPEDNLTLRELMQALPQESNFFKLYHDFMLRVLSRWVGASLSYSETPKMRVHFPQTSSVSSFHHDIIVTKRIDQVNFWLPFNTVDDTATLWLESDYGACDYHPIRVEYGQVLIFDGGYLGHGTKFNATETTRTSLDMRFSYKGSSTRADGVRLMNRIVDIAQELQTEQVTEGVIS